MPSLDRLARWLVGQDFTVLAVDAGEDAATVARFLASVPVSFPVVLDGDGAATAVWRAFAMPTTFLVDRQDRVRARIVGEADLDDPAMAWSMETMPAEKPAH